jgi:hypothetical protein
MTLAFTLVWVSISDKRTYSELFGKSRGADTISATHKANDQLLLRWHFRLGACLEILPLGARLALLEAGLLVVVGKLAEEGEGVLW